MKIDFSKLIEALPYVFSYVDADQRYVYHNRVYEEWFAGSRPADYGKTIQEVHGPKIYQQFLPHIERVLKGEAVAFESMIHTRDGRDRLVHVSFFPDSDTDGKVRGFFSRLEDITQRKRTDEAQLYHAAIVESSDDVIVSKSLEGIIQTWNKGAERIFGYKPEEVIGKPITIIIPPERLDEEKIILSRIRRGERIDHFETVRLTKDGRHVIMSITVSPIIDDAGKLIGVSKIARDITQQKKFEEELVRSNRDLEQFAYIASHDLQEPLRKVSLYTEMLDAKFAEALGADGLRYLANISNGVHHMRRLMEDLLSYARMGKEGIAKEDVDLTDLARDVIHESEVSIREKNAIVTVEPLPTIRANRFQMHRLLQNLLANAIKFNSSKPPRVRFYSISGEDGVTVAVEDNGIGIDPKYYENIFKVFQRLHGRDAYSGTGIGLAVCKKIAENHRGKIWLTSARGKGSTFFVRLPVLSRHEQISTLLVEHAQRTS